MSFLISENSLDNTQLGKTLNEMDPELRTIDARLKVMQG